MSCDRFLNNVFSTTDRLGQSQTMWLDVFNSDKQGFGGFGVGSGNSTAQILALQRELSPYLIDQPNFMDHKIIS